MKKATEIRRNMMLKEMDIRHLPNGKRNVISIKYVEKSGKLRFVPEAYIRGLPYSVQDARQRGIQVCDCNGEPTKDHVRPVGIDAILMFNGMEVIL